MGLNLKHAVEIIRFLQIYCPRPSELNDEDEFKPTFTASDLSVNAYRVEIEKWVRRCLAARKFTPTEEQIQVELRSLNQEKLNAIALELSKQFYDEINQRHRVISMTNSPFNHHLWSVYAQDYTGICFEFKISPWLTTMYKVEYEDFSKTLDLASNQDLDQLRVVALTKHAKWKAEEEFRMVLSDPPVEGGPLLYQNKLQLFPHMLSGIYFGYKIDYSHLKILLKDIR